MTSLTQTLPVAIFAEGSFLRRAAAVLAGSAFLAVMAQITVPMLPVPMTMQTLAVMLIGAFCGWRLAGETMLAYILEAVVGLPVLAGGASGVAKLLGPTGGYILGFLLGAALIGFLAERGWHRSLGGLIASLSLGHVLVFIPGVLWLAHFFGMEGEKGALALGLTPFIYGSIVKTALAAGVVMAAKRWTLRT